MMLEESQECVRLYERIRSGGDIQNVPIGRASSKEEEEIKKLRLERRLQEKKISKLEALEAELLARDKESNRKIEALQDEISNLKRISKEKDDKANEKSGRDEKLISAQSEEILELKAELLEMKETDKEKDAKIKGLQEKMSFLKKICQNGKYKLAREQIVVTSKNEEIRDLKTEITEKQKLIKEKDANIDGLQTKLSELEKIMDEKIAVVNANLQAKQKLVVSKDQEIDKIKAELSTKTNELEKKSADLKVLREVYSKSLLKSKETPEPLGKKYQTVSCPPQALQDVSKLPLMQIEDKVEEIKKECPGSSNASNSGSSNPGSTKPPSGRIPPGLQSRKSASPGKLIAFPYKRAPYCIPAPRTPREDKKFDQRFNKPYKCVHCEARFATLTERYSHCAKCFTQAVKPK